MASIIDRQQNGNIQLTITLPWENVKKAQEEVMRNVAQSAKLPGFRKGKAPKKLVEERVDKQVANEDVLKKILPQAYIEAVKEHNLKPIINPKVHVNKLEHEKDWEFTAVTAEMPKINLGNYKDNVKKLTAKSKIIVPGKDQPADGQGQQQPNFDEIVRTLLESVQVTVPQILIDQEVDRLLAQMLDEIKRLGLTLEQYLASTNRSPETLRQEYTKKAIDDITLEFVLQNIAETEGISVDEKEIEEAIVKAKDPKEKEHLEHNRYLLASILRQQKTLDFIKNL